MPVTILKRDELSSSKAGDGLGASAALLGEQFPVAVRAVGLVVLGRELLLSQLLVTLGTGEALPVPGLVLVSHAPLVNHPIAFAALLCKLFLIAWNAHGIIVTWYEALVSDWLLTNHAHEAFLMPLFALVFKLLHASSERLPASIAASGEVFIVTIGAVDVVIFGGKGLIHQGVLALTALKAEFVPMTIFVGQILVVWPNGFLAFFTVVCVQFLVAWDAVGVFVLYDVATGHQFFVAVVAG